MSPNENGIVWYGERGVVNGIVVAIASDIEKKKRFLRCIDWCETGADDWIDKVTDVTFLVEIGLADFGNPDLILFCECDGEKPLRVIFIEAKVLPYLSSAISNHDGMSDQKFNSSINGQLSLKHRFACSLEKWKGGRQEISEPREKHLGYCEQLKDPTNRPRRLKKPEVLKLLKDLSGLHEERCSYVAMTWDSENPLKTAEDRFRPLFCGPDGCVNVRHRLGWIDYHQVKEIDDCFWPTLDAMVQTSQPYVPDKSCSRLTTQKIGIFSQHTRDILQIATNAAAEIFGEDVHALAGSVSVKWSQVEAKLIPLTIRGKEVVLLGVRPTYKLEDWTNLAPTSYKVNKEVFQFIELPNNSEKARLVASQVFQQLDEILNQDIVPVATVRE